MNENSCPICHRGDDACTHSFSDQVKSFRRLLREAREKIEYLEAKITALPPTEKPKRVDHWRRKQSVLGNCSACGKPNDRHGASNYCTECYAKRKRYYPEPEGTQRHCKTCKRRVRAASRLYREFCSVECRRAALLVAE